MADQKGDQYSSQAESYSVTFDKYHNEIPEKSGGSPDYSGDQYAGSNDSTHPKNG